MNSTNILPHSNVGDVDIKDHQTRIPSFAPLVRVGIILTLSACLVTTLYSASSVRSVSKHGPSEPLKVTLNQSTSTATAVLDQPFFRAATFPLVSPFLPPSISIYASDCTTPKTVFNLQDSDLSVCAKVTGTDPSWRIIWSNAKFIAVQNVAVGDGTNTFTLTHASSVGDWRVILFEPFGGTVQSVTSFTVIDEQNPLADLSVSKTASASIASSGSQVVYSIQISNSGPNAAAAVQLTDSVPANTTFVSLAQLSGPTFVCNTPDVGQTGTSVCSVGNLARGESAIFVATYQIGVVSNGTLISSTSTVTNTIPDPNSENNSSTATLETISAPCQLSSPGNITVDADPGQAGAVVTYSTPTGTGDCGQTSTGENGETIPAISCNPASGSFFPVGTSAVICTAQTGSAVSFQVSVNNPGALSISLNGADTMTVECGTDFTDPGATAINGSGQSVPVVLTLPQNFNPDSPAIGSYILTYTATEDPNSVSTTRTVNVSDTEGPAITISGANPYRIQQGSCSPFVDPGASALDACGGPKPITSSISGPNGLTSVDPNTPGSYTVTYTATDGTHEGTANRTVLVGQFSEDEIDQPATSNQPPTITLNGDAQISIECGTVFTDPGATATVCGNSIPVTTSGTVDIHAPGTYSITYTASANSQTTETTRIVTVEADHTAPTITINGATIITVECHTGFTDPGATAHDACAGDFVAAASGVVDPNTVGQYVITYNTTDPSGHTATPIMRTVNVVDTTAPTVTPPPNVNINTGPGSASCGTLVSDSTLGTANASDSCAGVLSVTRSGVPAGNQFPVGNTVVTYSATDAHGNTASATQTVTVVDNTAPVITLNGQSHSMWPPNHKYKTFQVSDFVASAIDNCDTNVSVGTVVIETVTSDETENGNDDGNTSNDIVIAPDCKSLQLRSERDGGGDGRVYTITFKVTDSAGNVTHATATVVVPHNPGQSAIDSGPHYSVNGTCP